MRIYQIGLIVTLTLFTLNGCVTALFEEEFSEHSWSSALRGEHRSNNNKERDKFRHPQDTLTFFQLKPDQTVVEIWPSTGWYTEILGPLLAGRGQLYAAHFSKETKVKYFAKNRRDFLEKMQAFPEKFGRIKVTDFEPPKHVDIAPAGTADRVLTFRNVHNWMKNKQELHAFKAFYKALKPGGMLGVVEHRAAPSTTRNQMVKSGYVTEEYIKQVAQQAGFQFLKSSEVNANPRDQKNHPEGVWTLPPTLRLGNRDRTKYLNIGESDRMTLLFLKPE